jgi:two-component system sensor histidine kinase SenX3
MTPSRQNIVAYALPSLVVAAFAIFLAFSLATLVRIEQDMRDNVGENMLWVLTQAEIAGLRFDEEVSRRTSGDVETTDLKLRYNVLLSRLKLLSQGPQARYLDAAGFGEAIADRADAVLALQPILGKVQPGARAASSTVHDILQPLNAVLGRAANAAMIAKWEQSGARLDRHRNAIQQIIGAAIGVLLIGLFLSASLMRNLGKARSAERALAHHSTQLEQLVRDRTRELENTAAALEGALSREQSVSEFYRSFAAMVSHQFRTPLAVIDSGIQRLARRSGVVPPSEITERATRIRSAVARMSALIDSTLSAARLDAERKQVRLAQKCDVVMLLRDVCAHQQAVAPDRRIVLDFRAGEPLVARCDPVLVEQIVANLLSNALKYSPPETAVALEVWANDGSIHCAVSDEGVGIPADEARHLFDRFFRASTAGDIAGTGLGLNLARHLARIHDGDVTVESQEGAGSTFTVRLPCAGPESETQAAS